VLRVDLGFRLLRRVCVIASACGELGFSTPELNVWLSSRVLRRVFVLVCVRSGSVNLG
jgi:hypothetical protein